MPKKKTNEEFIQDAIKIHGDKYDYSKVDYTGSKNKVIIICREHGEFEQRPNGHLRGAECFSCNGSKKYTTSEWVEKAKEVHGDKYNYLKVEYNGIKNKIIIVCKIHGDFKQLPTDHINGSNCSKCMGLHNYSNQEWIEEAKKIHGNKYDYSKVKYINNRINIIIGCKTHGDVKQTPKLHMKSNGCPKCSITFSPTSEEWITKAKEVHRNEYDYSKVNYRSNKNKVIIICKEHGEFKQTPNSHLLGNGCASCGYNRNSKTFSIGTNEFIKRSK